jgi:biotin transport system permease protein
MTVPGIQFVEGDTYLHRRHPMAKLVVFLMLIAGLLIFESRIVPVAAAALLFAVQLGAGLGMKKYLGVARRFLFFALLIILAQLLLLRQSGSVPERLMSGLVQAVRIFDLLVLASLFAAVTDPVDLTDALIRGMRPLERVGARTGGLSLMLMIVFSFLPLMGGEVERLAIAQGARSGFGGGPYSRIRNSVPLLGALVVGIMRRAEEVELSLAARRYDITGARHMDGGMRMTGADYIFSAIFMALFAVGVYAKL